MLRFLLPVKVEFFDYFDQHVVLQLKAVNQIQEMVQGNNGHELAEYARRVHELEHQADSITKQCIIGLHKTFITPIDRGDIHRLITCLDDVMDFTDSAISRMALYHLDKFRPEVGEFMKTLQAAIVELAGAITSLRCIGKNSELINQHCEAIHNLESQADVILANGLAQLFDNETNPMVVMKWKEVFESFEAALDTCQDVAIILENLVIEAS